MCNIFFDVSGNCFVLLLVCWSNQCNDVGQGKFVWREMVAIRGSFLGNLGTFD